MNDNNPITIKDLEKKLWDSADALRGNLSAEEYMHVVLDILVLKYINDKYDNAIVKLEKMGFSKNEISKEELSTEDAFDVPEKSKWSYIMKFVNTPSIGEVLDDALIELGKANEELQGIFSATYNDEDIDKTRLSEVIKIFQYGDLSNHGEDILGRIYEYFLGNFFLKRGQKGGEFYTPRSIVRLITLFLKPTKGRIYDPACGTGGMLVQAKQYIESVEGNLNEITVYGQEFNKTTWNLAKLNLILNGFSILNINDKGELEGALGKQSADTFTNDQHKDRVFDYIMANPPFNLKVWRREELESDPRWVYGLPPKNNANFAWLQHILYKLAPKGKAGVVLANGSLTSSTGGEDDIRKKIIQDNKVSCIVSLPDKLFYTTGISACIWFFDNNKSSNDVLFIDAQELGTLIEGSKANKEIKDENLKKLASIYSDFEQGKKIDIPGLAKSVSIDEIKENDYSLLPGKYISIPETKRKDPEIIKKELKEDINELTKLIDESKELENELLEAIKLLDL